MTNCRGFAGEAEAIITSKAQPLNAVSEVRRTSDVHPCSRLVWIRAKRAYSFSNGRAAMSKDFVQRRCCRSWHGFRRRMAKARIAKRARSTCRHVTKETEIFLRSCDAKEQTLPYSICTCTRTIWAHLTPA